MVCNPTSTNLAPASRRRAGGFLLPETLISFGIMGILVAAIASFTLFSGRSFAALFNYVDLNDDNRVAIDLLTSDVRQADKVFAYTTNALILEEDSNYTIYYYSPYRQMFFRIRNGVPKVLLKNCEWLNVQFGQRNTVGGSYEVFPAATPETAKVINISWVCNRTIFGDRANSEAVQTARIVIRKQGT